MPAMARATSFGSNGRKSSTPSPTPIAWIGRPYFSAAATSTPSRAATHGGTHVVLGDFCERKVVDAVVTGARQHTNAEMNE